MATKPGTSALQTITIQRQSNLLRQYTMQNKKLRAVLTQLHAACEAMNEFWMSGTPVHSGAEVVSDLQAAMAKAKIFTEAEETPR